MHRSDRSWVKWSETEPYFGVLTDPKYLSESLEENRAEFWETGRTYVRDTLSHLEKHFGPLRRRRALDFGCGVGRLTLALADHFDEAVGVDVAPGMTAEAARNAAACGCENAVFFCSDGASPATRPEFDLVNSYIVLQHIPISRGMPIVDALLRSVAEGGMVNLHLSVDRHDSPLQSLRYWGQCNVPGFNGLVNLVRGRAFNRPHMQMNPYPLHEVLALFMKHNFGPIVSMVEFHERVMTTTLCARRNGNS